MPDHSNNHRDRALVIGGSLSGLLAARVLSSHFDNVTLIDRDSFPSGAEFRSGVPQSRHLHVLLIKGMEVFERYFPGLSEELIAHEATPADIGDEFFYDSVFGPLAPFPSGLKLLLCSRNLIEWSVRERLKALNNVRVISQVDATGFLTRDDHRQIYGVQLRTRGGASETETLTADLVVDASGRVSKTTDWLSALGYPKPEIKVVNSHLGYSTRWYKRPKNPKTQWKGILINVKPPHNPRGGGLFSAEGGLWIITLAGIAGLYPPTDDEGFMDFARQLSHPALYEAICEAEPVTQIYGYRRTENQWRHYERLTRWPGGLLVIGDAVCCFNPVYGQGMTSAAMGASLLDDQLRTIKDASSSEFGKGFQSQLAKFLETPWLIATGEDFRWENTEGDRPGRAARVVQGYMDRVVRLATLDAHAQRSFLEVVHLLKPPMSLFHPRILIPALTRRIEQEAF